MVARGLHAPEHVVETEAQPRDGNVVAHERRREHPGEVARSETPEVGILDEVHLVVPLHELVAQPDREHRDDGQHDGQGKDALRERERRQASAEG